MSKQPTRKEEIQAKLYLQGQSFELQPLVTDCIVKADTFTKAKELFDKSKDDYVKSRVSESISKLRAIIRESLLNEQSWSVMGSFVREDPMRYQMQNISQKLKEKKKIDRNQLAIGTQEELEHTENPSIARKIAIDHLKVDPKYYIKLKRAGIKEQKPQVEPEIEPDEPGTITEPAPDTPETEPVRWSPFRPDIDPSISPQPKAFRRKK